LRKARSAFHDRDLLDFLDPHRRLRRRKRLVRSLLIIGTLVSLFALMMLSSASPFSPTKAVSKILARKFGNGASQKSAAFSWGGAELRDVKIDPKNDSRVGRATAQIEWNPLSKQFGSPKSLELGEFDVHWQWTDVLSMLNRKPKGKADESAYDPSLAKVRLTGGVLSIGANKDTADIKLENVFGNFDRQSMSGSFSAAKFYFRGKLVDVDVRAEVLADAKRGLSLRIKQGEKKIGWTVELSSGEGLKEAALKMKLLQPSPELRAFLPLSMQTSDHLRGHALIKLAVLAGGKELSFSSNGDVEGLQVLDPEIARKELKFGKLSWHGDGQVDVLSRRINAPNIVLMLDSMANSGKQSLAAAQMRLAVDGKFGGNDSGTWQLDVEVPTSDCGAVKKSLPEGLFDVVVDEVKLTGKLNSKIRMQFQNGLSKLASVSHPVGQFDCNLEVGLPKISSLLLRTAKSLSRSPTGVWTLSRAEPATMAQAITTYDVLPDHLISAVINAEDKRFMSHDGFDWIGLMNAFKKNLQASEFVLGGSTISQQVAKNLFLNPEKSLARKLEEAFLTWHIEKSIPKERIMEIYLNVAHWAPGVYGIREAARFYFGKDPKKLDVKESVFLASILPNPDRRARVLCSSEGRLKFNELASRTVSGMLKVGMITPDATTSANAAAPQFPAHSDAQSKICGSGPPTAMGDGEKSQRSSQVR